MNKKSGYTYLLKNIGLLTLSQFATKLLSFFFVPIYTSILTTTEYGTYDLFSATIGVLLPILTLNIHEAVIRFALDKNSNKNAIATISLRYVLISNLIVIVGLLINRKFGCVKTISDYAIFFFLMFFMQSWSGVLTSFARGTERIADLSIAAALASATIIFCNILFLVVFRLGLVGYFLASTAGPLVQVIYLTIRSKFLSYIRTEKYTKENKELTGYSRPLIANSIAWWINNMSDRYVVIFFCGLAENGIYSVAGKIPTILNIFQTIFNQAWTLSAVKDFDPEDKDGFFTNTYNVYNGLLVVVCAGIIMADKILAKFLYAKDFYVAWKYVPWLTIAILFGALSGYIGGFFSAVKNPRIFATSTIIGAVVNLILNLIFTPIYGALGAAVATAICYLVVWAFRYWQSRKYIKLKINIIKDILAYLLLTVQSVYLLFDSKHYLYVEILLFMIIFFMYAGVMKQVFVKLKGKMKHGRHQ